MASELEPVYLVLGTDRTKLTQVFERLRKRFSDEAIETWDASATPAADVIGACMALGLLADLRLHIVQGVDAWKPDDVDQLLAYVAAPSPDNVLVLVAEKLAANSRLRKAFAKPRLIECKAPEKESSLAAWVVKAFAAEGVKVDARTATRLVQLCGTDSLDRLATDVARIVTYAGGEPITEQMVEQLATQHSEEKVWALTDAWASRDRSSLLKMTEQLLAQREHPVRLTGVIARHLRMVHTARRLLATEPAGVVTQRLVESGANKWVAGRYVEQAGRINLPQADAALARVAQLDAELKGASALSSGRVGEGRDGARVVFERGMAELL